MLENLPIIVNASLNLKDDGSFLFSPRLIDVAEETSLEKEEFNKKEIELLGVNLNEEIKFNDQNNLLSKYGDVKSIVDPLNDG